MQNLTTNIPITNINFQELAKKYDTPLYIYDLDYIQGQYELIKDVLFSYKSLICYALKANSNLCIIKHLARLGSGADCVSINEIKRAVLGGIPKYKIIFSGVGKSAFEIREALGLDILLINVESKEELEMIETIASDMGKIARISIRVNPNINANTHPYISTGLNENKFGVQLEEAKRLYLYINKSKHLSAVGIHFHIGSQILDKAPMLESYHIVLDLARSIKAINKDLRFFDIGGGFGINYQKDEEMFDIKEYLSEIIISVNKLDLSLITEPGRFLLGNAGFLLTRVLRKKKNISKNFIIIDAAMNDLIRPSLYNAVHEIIHIDSKNTHDNLKKAKSLNLEIESKAQSSAHKSTNNTSNNILKSDVVGPICESGDYLAKDVELECESGDLLVVKSAGAYAYSMSSNYNSRMRPAEIAICQDEGGGVRDFLIKDREDFQKSIENELQHLKNI